MYKTIVLIWMPDISRHPVSLNSFYASTKEAAADKALSFISNIETIDEAWYKKKILTGLLITIPFDIGYALVTLTKLDDVDERNIFFEYQKKRHLEDARNQFIDYVFCEIGAHEIFDESDLLSYKKERENFFERYGVDVVSLITPGSKDYVLETLVEIFEMKADINECEVLTWQKVIGNFLDELRKSRFDTY